MSRHEERRGRQGYNIPGHAHELTFSCYRRHPFFKADRCCRWLAEAIQQSRSKQAFHVWAFVFMPDHVHLILYPHAKTYSMARILEEIKRPVGRQAISYLRKINSPWVAHLARKRGQRTERVFWQSGGGYDRNITSPRTLLRMIDYLHDNPLRKKLVIDPSDWHWSSARHYVGGDTPISYRPDTARVA